MCEIIWILTTYLNALKLQNLTGFPMHLNLFYYRNHCMLLNYAPVTLTEARIYRGMCDIAIYTIYRDKPRFCRFPR